MSKPVSFPKRALNKDDLRLCLATWAEQPQMSLAATAKHLELSQQRVSNAQQWAILSNFLNSQGLTSTGKLALEKDPYLEATVTDWVIHFHGSLNRPISLGSSYEYGILDSFIHNFLGTNPKFHRAPRLIKNPGNCGLKKEHSETESTLL